MKLSTKGRYAARLMLDLAIYYGKGPILIKDIAERQEVSDKYLGHLIPSLKAVGLINSARGAHGGYLLAKTPGDITLGEVIQAAEGNLAIVECVAAPSVCGRIDFCVTRDIWKGISEKIMELLDSITLEDMVEMHKKKQAIHSLMYSI